MTRERIEDMREVVLPFVKKRLLETNYEGLGESDAEEFAREFNEILNLAIKALEQEPISETDIILTREEYGELVSSEYDNGYAQGYREALEQESKTGHISIDDVMSVFDDFMCGEVDEDGMETFLEMLKDKAESEG